MLFQTNGELPKIRLMNSVIIRPPYIHYKRKPDEYILYIIKKGAMYLKVGDERYELLPGDFLLLEPNVIHEGYETSYCEYYYIHCKWNQLMKTEFPTLEDKLDYILMKRNNSLKSNTIGYESTNDNKVVIPKYFNYSNYNDFIHICCILDEAIRYNETPLEYYKVLTSLKVMEFLIETYRCYVLDHIESTTTYIPKSYIKVQELLSYLNSNYKEKISSHTIEEITGNNFDYINRVFRQMTNKTIFQYLNTIRINHAKELIATTNMKISDVGGEVGFQDLYYFSKVFKKATGTSPSIYAKAVLK